jgi:hypothetical protein
MYCESCSWQIKDGDRFCAGCGKELISIKETPLDGGEIHVFQGSNKTCFHLANTGIVSVFVTKIESDGLVLKDVNPSCPFPIDAGSEKDIFIEFNGDIKMDTTGRIRISTSVKNINYTVKVVQMPKLSVLINDVECQPDKDTFIYYKSDEKTITGQICLDSYEDRFDFSLISTEENGLPTLRLMHPADPINQVAISNTKPFDFEIELLPDARETTQLQIILNSQMLGQKNINVKLQKHDGPKPNHIPPDYPTNIILGGQIDHSIKVRLFNIGKSPMRILDLETTAPWISLNKNFERFVNIGDSNNGFIELEFKIISSKINKNALNETDTQDGIIYVLRGQGIKLFYEDVEISKKEPFYFIPIEIPVNKPQILKSPLTIDFGTTNTCVAFKHNDSTKIEVIKLEATEQNPEEMPTCIGFHDYDKNDLEVGMLSFARRNINLNFFKATAYGWKQNLPDNNAQTFWDEQGRIRRYTPVQLTAIFVDKIIKIFESYYPYKVDTVSLTYPAVFSIQKHKLVSAMKELNFDESKVKVEISEPEALTFGYIYDHRDELENLVNIDIESVSKTKIIIDGLNKNTISEDLKSALEKRNINLYPNAIISVESTGNKWRINDLQKEYIIKKDEKDGKLKIYGDDYFIGVYDFGGGTVDITIARVSISENLKRITVLSSDGIAGKGGNYVTHLLAKKLHGLFLNEIGKNSSRDNQDNSQDKVFPFPSEHNEVVSLIQDDTQRENYRLLRLAAENLKFKYNEFDEKSGIEVGFGIDTGFGVDHGALQAIDGSRNRDVTVKVSKSDFDVAVIDAITESIQVLNDMIQRLFDKDELGSKVSLDVLILAGNGSKLKLVETLAQRLVNVASTGNGKKDIRIDYDNMKKGVAKGACYYNVRQKTEGKGVIFEGINRLMYAIGYDGGDVCFEEAFPQGAMIDSIDPNDPNASNYLTPNPVYIDQYRQPFSIYMNKSNVKRPPIFNNGDIIRLGDIIVSKGENLLFSINPSDENPLNEEELPADLRNEFENNGYPLPDDYKATFIGKEKKWSITNAKGDIIYIVKKEDNRLDVFEEYDLKGKKILIQMQISQENRRILNYIIFVTDESNPARYHEAKRDSVELTGML